MKKLLFIILCSVISSTLSAQLIFIPLGDPVYNFIERLETKSIIKNIALSTKPISRRYVSEILNHIEKDKLNEIELVEYNKYLDEYYNPFNEKGHLFKYNYKDAVIYFDPVFQAIFEFNDSNDEEEAKNGKHYEGGGEIYGSYSDKIGFYFKGTNNSETGNFREIRNLDNEEQGNKECGELKYYSKADAYLSYSNKFFDLIFGRYSNYWGNGETGSLTLSNKPPSYNQLMLKFDYFEKIKFTYFHAKLFSDVRDDNSSYTIYYHYEDGEVDSFPRDFYKKKYLAGHRLEILPFNNFKFAFNELSYYGERELDWSYLNPFMFFWVAKNKTNDQDNLQISLDAEWNLFNKVKLYGTFFIDELSLSKMFDKKHNRNQIAGQIGCYLVEPIIPCLDFRLEYTALNPWTYTHKFPTCTAYNNNYVMGYWTGQNADNLYLAADYRLNKNLKTNIAFSRYRKGGLTPISNQYDNIAEKFLYGLQYEKLRITFNLSYNIWKKCILSVKYQYTDLNINEENYNNPIYVNKHIYDKDFTKNSLSFSVKYNIY